MYNVYNTMWNIIAIIYATKRTAHNTIYEQIKM